MKKLGIGFLGLLVLILGGLWLGLRVPAVQDALFSQAIEARLGNPPELHDEAALNVVFCGTGGPLPDPDRAGPCIAVYAGDRLYLIDSGTGGAMALAGLGAPMGQLRGIFYTHLHSDHIAGLGDAALMSWSAGRRVPLSLYGPPGVDDLAAGFERAYQIDARSRIDHHGSAIFAPDGASLAARPVVVEGAEEVVTLVDDGGLKITAFRVTHPPLENAYGYRVDYHGRSVIFSGDTMKDPQIARVGAGVDVMVHEAMANPLMLMMADGLETASNSAAATILRDATTNHSLPVEAAQTANEAGAGLLVFSHVLPPMPAGFVEDMFLRGVDEVRPEATLLGFDGLWLSLGAGTQGIEQRDLR